MMKIIHFNNEKNYTLDQLKNYIQTQKNRFFCYKFQ